jgi:phage terminase large subunit
MQNGVALVKADNNRVQGHMLIKDALALRKDGKPGIIFFNTCESIINDIRDIQADDNNPDDCAKEPHDITHTVDSIRYYCVSRHMPAELPEVPDYNDEETEEEYSDFMTGGEMDAGYINY